MGYICHVWFRDRVVGGEKGRNASITVQAEAIKNFVGFQAQTEVAPVCLPCSVPSTSPVLQDQVCSLPSPPPLKMKRASGVKQGVLGVWGPSRRPLMQCFNSPGGGTEIAGPKREERNVMKAKEGGYETQR